MCSSIGFDKFIMKNINMAFFVVSIKAIYLKNEFI